MSTTQTTAKPAQLRQDGFMFNMGERRKASLHPAKPNPNRGTGRWGQILARLRVESLQTVISELDGQKRKLKQEAKRKDLRSKEAMQCAREWETTKRYLRTLKACQRLELEVAWGKYPTFGCLEKLLRRVETVRHEVVVDWSGVVPVAEEPDWVVPEVQRHPVAPKGLVTGWLGVRLTAGQLARRLGVSTGELNAAWPQFTALVKALGYRLEEGSGVQRGLDGESRPVTGYSLVKAGSLPSPWAGLLTLADVQSASTH